MWWDKVRSLQFITDSDLFDLRWGFRAKPLDGSKSSILPDDTHIHLRVRFADIDILCNIIKNDKICIIII